MEWYIHVEENAIILLTPSAHDTRGTLQHCVVAMVTNTV